MFQHFRILSVSVLFALVATTAANATVFPPGPPPKLQYAEAVRLATKFASEHEHRIDISKAWVDRVWLSRIPGNPKLCWIVSFSVPNTTYYFVAVYMNGKAFHPPHGPIYTDSPFEEWHIVLPGERHPAKARVP